MTFDRQARCAFALALLSYGCGDDATPSAGTTSEPGSSGTDSSPGMTGMALDTTGSDAADDTGPANTTDGSTDTGEPSGDTGEPPGPPLPCPDEWACQTDRDGDDHPFVCDNAPDHFNPGQGDMDYDSIGDVSDLCPTVQSLANTHDSDRDGVGSSCDVCPLPASSYGAPLLAEALQVRNTPHQGDFDRDGVGDACDNCPLLPNCLGYGDGPGLTPWVPGFPLDPADPECAPDSDGDGIGDACEGMAGVSFGATDDWDGDGIDNDSDLCLRARAPEGGHPDPDGDGIGTECDVCPFVADPAQADDDGDFIGDACEENAACVSRANPRALGFYDVEVGGYCCTTVYGGEALEDPDGMPLSVDDLPVTTPGLLELPPGCAAALADSGATTATQLGPDDVGSLAELWSHMCLLPTWDQDFDALPDTCDLCAFAFDPANTPYTDVNGMVWPSDGAYCNGEYHCDAG